MNATTVALAPSASLDDNAAWLARLTPLASQGMLTLDFADTRVDSSTLALLASLRRSARQGGQPLTLSNVPPALESLARLYGAGELLGEEAST